MRFSRWCIPPGILPNWDNSQAEALERNHKIPRCLLVSSVIQRQSRKQPSRARVSDSPTVLQSVNCSDPHHRKTCQPAIRGATPRIAARKESLIAILRPWNRACLWLHAFLPEGAIRSRPERSRSASDSLCFRMRRGLRQPPTRPWLRQRKFNSSRLRSAICLRGNFFGTPFALHKELFAYGTAKSRRSL